MRAKEANAKGNESKRLLVHYWPPKIGCNQNFHKIKKKKKKFQGKFVSAITSIERFKARLVPSEAFKARAAASANTESRKVGEVAEGITADADRVTAEGLLALVEGQHGDEEEEAAFKDIALELRKNSY